MITLIKHVFKLQFLLIIVFTLAGVYYPQINEMFWKKSSIIDEKTVDVSCKSADNLLHTRNKLFTKKELSDFNGVNGTPIYLALLGRVYDVSKSAKHYGPGCSYSFFAGRDASVSFLTGEFENYVEKEADDVLSLNPSELVSLLNWQKFYEKHYVFKGKLVGRFYDAFGNITIYHRKYLTLLQQAQDSKATREEFEIKYPDCNIEWSKEKGSHVWCTHKSGGKERSWIGYPRKIFQLGNDNFRCACLRKEDLHTTEVMIKTYDDCESFAHECYYHVN